MVWVTLYSNDYLKGEYLTLKAVNCKAAGLNLADIAFEVLELYESLESVGSCSSWLGVDTNPTPLDT